MKRLLRLPEVEQNTGFKRANIYKQIKLGNFPKPVKIGSRAVAWRESDIQGWIDSRTSEGGAAK
jgi:prophage regulatory protein